MTWPSMAASAPASACAAGESSYRGPCRLLGSHITRVTRQGASTVHCAEFCHPDGTCQIRLAMLEPGSAQALGAASPVVEPVAVRCLMLTI